MSILGSIFMKASKASRTAAKVTGTGTKTLGSSRQTYSVKCTASSGQISRVYQVTILR